MRIGTGLIITVMSTVALMAYAAAPPGGSNELRPRVAAAPAKRDSETPRGEAREIAPRDSNKAATRDARIWPCQITLIDDVEVPAPESGILVAMEVREEQAVTQGQLLAVVDSRQQAMQRDASVIERNAAAAKAAGKTDAGPPQIGMYAQLLPRLHDLGELRLRRAQIHLGFATARVAKK